jgi:hypothetical protein
MNYRMFFKIISGTGIFILTLIFTSCQKDISPPDPGNIIITPVTIDDLNADNVSTAMFSTDSISIYPNPFQQNTYLKITGLRDELVEIKISDKSGFFHTQYKQISNGNIFLEIDFTDLPKGGYLCDIIAGNTVFRTELLKLLN